MLIHVLLAAAALSLALGHRLDAAVILGVVLVNALVGFHREGRAERAIAAVGRLLAPRARVLRDGEWRELSAEELVPGDRIRLKAGDRVPADARLLEAHGLEVDEAILTGESLPVAKDAAPVPETAALAERRSLVFAGTMAVRGEALAVVTATGTATEVGRISALLERVQRVETPLTRELARFGWRVSAGIVAAALLLVPVALGVGGLEPGEALLAAVAFAVAAIPEGLPAIVTITLAVGVERMARRHALVRRLPAVETLGQVSVILTDKTGTLTENRLAVTHLALGGRVAPVEALEEEGALGPVIEALAASLEPSAAQDPLERALVELVARLAPGLVAAPLGERLAVLPFSPEWKMSAVRRGERLLAKGAPEVLLDRCAFADPAAAARWREALDRLAGEGLRVIALAARQARGERGALLPEAVGELEMLALIGLSDPPRPEVPEAIARCREAGIAVRIVTGDHPATALALARRIGLAASRGALTGPELDGLGRRALAERLRAYEVFARTTPEDKLRLVEALQAEGHCVAMTGDGVNDAPALRRADIGVAMGRRGAEAAREAAEIVLADDHFATIVAGIEEGRGVEDNLRKSLAFVLPTNAAQAAVVAVALLLGLTLPLTPVQILWVNMVTAVTLALALAVEPLESEVMRRPAVRRRGLVTPFMLARILWVGLLLTVLTVGSFLVGKGLGLALESARSLAFNVLVCGEVGYLFAMRRWLEPGFRPRALLANRTALGAALLLLALQVLATAHPLGQRLLGTGALEVGGWLAALGAGLLIFALVEAEKWALRSARGRRTLP
ncbi:MAG: HAD-IC family P-type ATPase [Xanthomonadales bacterium]|nr:HAD-IC family P-type ATPase [Xanthomonadales bacterium]